MSFFRINSLNQNSILYIYAERDVINVDPVYQRVSDVWNLEKKQLLIDSIINEYDIPKLYFHELEGSGHSAKYSIIDGKQRLKAIWSFIDGDFSLSEEMVYLHDPKIILKGLSYLEIAERYPRLKLKFDSYSLSIVTVATDDEELIEDMFYRLNEAEPLSAAEKRNAMGGHITKCIRQVASHKFFTDRVPFKNSRQRHFDLASKFFYVIYRNEISDTKKIHLDKFVSMFKKEAESSSEKLNDQVVHVLDSMSNVFESNDPLLRSSGMIMLYFYIFQDKALTKDRKVFLQFEEARSFNRKQAEESIGEANYDYLEFDRLTQSLNDGVAMKFRYQTMKTFIESKSNGA